MTDPAKPFNVLKPGKFKPVSGPEVDFTDAILTEIATSYDPKLHQAPMVKGHPKMDDPAYGWIKGVTFADGLLQVLPDQVNADFADGVKRGEYKFVSGSFYPPNAANNPTPGKWYLRHVGFLGAMPPAVKGLGAVSFADDDQAITFDFAEGEFATGWDLRTLARMVRGFKNWLIEKEGQDVADKVFPEYSVEDISESAGEKIAAARATAFAEPEPAAAAATDPKAVDLSEREVALDAKKRELDERQAKLDARDREARAALDAEFADDLIGQGRMTPAQKPVVLTILQELAGGNEVSFGEGDAALKMPVADALKTFLKTLPRQIELGERAPLGASIDLSDPEALGEAAKQLIDAEAAKGITITATQAVERITKGA